MKSILVLMMVTFLFTTSCEKSETEPECFKVKYIDGMCYTNICQIVTPAFQHLGQDNWLRQSNGIVYDNVFVLSNYCENLGAMNSDSTFTVRLLRTDEVNNRNCITCLAAYINPPTKSLALKACN